jgi:hypothetical protein
MYDWNCSSFTEFKNCDDNLCIGKGIKRIIRIIDDIYRFLENVKVFVTK